MPDATLRRLSDLPDAERAAVRRTLADAPAAAVAEGWEPWELPEYVAAVARSLGVILSNADKAALNPTERTCL